MERLMKDSGIEWIGEIPKAWDTIKFKYLFSITGGNGFPESLQGQNEGTYPFCKVSDINGHSDYVDTAANYVTDEVVQVHGFNIIPQGSIIIAKIGAALQKNHRKINSVPCCIDNNTQALVPIRNDSIRYLLYLTRCIDMGWFDNNSTVPSLNNNKLLNFLVPNVGIDEQHRIADFLDRKCAEIDAVIEKTKATIEEYKKLKQSVITEAVTKGIRGNRPMKDSGVEMLGVIPSEWTCTRVSRIATVVRGGSPRPAGDSRFFNGNYIPWITVAEVTNTIGHYIISTETCLTEEGAKCSRIVEAGTLLLSNSGATLGVPKITNIRGCINDGSVAFYNLEIDKMYLLYVFASYTEELRKQRQGYGQPNLNTDIIKGLYIPQPPVDEQNEIVAYLDEKCAALDTLISKKTALLTELETYKKSLIYEYVTGKKEVPYVEETY